MKKMVYAALFLLYSSMFSFADTKANIKSGSILHCWCWSFKTIKANIERIKDAGFTAIQTSPVNACLIGDNGGMELMSSSNGKWYYHYQPTDFTIGNYQLGTRDEFISMCKAAKENNIAVIVDIVPNHTTPMIDKVSKEMIEYCGGLENFYHKGKNQGIRSSIINSKVGGLPDINTENPKFQEYLGNFLKDLEYCGADGFRIDCAKHIALPDDPKDDEKLPNNFYSFITRNRNMFVYGEVLQDANSREEEYGKYISVTASNYGKLLRSAAKNKKFPAKGIVNFQNKASPNLVTWVESHDTYANKGESACLTDFEIRSAWAVIAARKEGTPLFFSRPKGKEAIQFPGESKIGDAGNDEFFNPEIKALNRFRLEMKDEMNMFFNDENGILYIRRGNKGLVIINPKEKELNVEFKSSLPEKKYSDRAWGIKFKVNKGLIKGKIPAQKICVIY
ncbi:MAG: alpha-amylase family protein [Treponema sp.]|uniref:alpha-amylase family protein n=1 Tax=Treponema sp. TaxID=166 RepID=UPI001D36D3CE|nr:alpha-amylase family protein [Treponema sp.]MBS7242623.1 alpha-amylase family protein [Treponema sp.]MCI6441693.1 alpha-amylase family protein [Spirochaetia bacterium]